MIFPFESLSGISREAGLVVAVLIGFGFGFVLERAGFGRSTKLAAQFYLRDMTVFKVMFSAIVTAMLGLVAAAGLGLTDLRAISESIASWTWIWPMLAGGLLLGVGFILSGYCPGTSLVAAASGNVDGMFAVAGVVTGTFLYSELLRIEAFARFHVSGAREAWFLYDLVPVPPQLLAVGIALMAVGAFVGAEKVEKLVAGGRAAPAAVTVRGLRVASAVFASLAVVALVALVMPPRTQAAALEPVKSMAPSELAKVVATEPWTLRIVDVRPAEVFAKGTIPGAENVDPKSLGELPDDGRTVVVVADGVTALPPTRFAIASYAGWKADPLATQLSGGRVAAAPAVARPTGTFTRPKKKGGGCSA